MIRAAWGVIFGQSFYLYIGFVCNGMAMSLQAYWLVA